MRRIETALWLVGLLCLAVYGVARMQSARAQLSAIAVLEAQWQQEALSEPDRSLWSAARIAAYEQSQAGADALSPRALLSIPSVGVRVAVFEGTSDRTLNLGAGRVPGTGSVRCGRQSRARRPSGRFFSGPERHSD